MLNLTVVAVTFGPIFLVELPDKTFVATLVLSARYRPLAVWLGVGLAFGVQSLVAVTAGKLATALPEWVLHTITAVIFAVGAVLLFKSAPNADKEEKQTEQEYESKAATSRPFFKAAVSSFLLIFAAEWGDLSQLLTISLVARYKDAVSVFVGSWVALLVVSGLAAVAGRVLLRYMRLSILHYIGGTVCLGFAALTTYQAVAG